MKQLELSPKKRKKYVHDDSPEDQYGFSVTEDITGEIVLMRGTTVIAKRRYSKNMRNEIVVGWKKLYGKKMKAMHFIIRPDIRQSDLDRINLDALIACKKRERFVD